MSQTQAEARYNVECMVCGQVFTPTIRSSLWWQAKQREEQGYLDALRVSGKECGCIAQPVRPDAPFRVVGYDDMCVDFDIPCDTFVDVIKVCRQLGAGDTFFITGVSDAVSDKLCF